MTLPTRNSRSAHAPLARKSARPPGLGSAACTGGGQSAQGTDVSMSPQQDCYFASLVLIFSSNKRQWSALPSNHVRKDLLFSGEGVSLATQLVACPVPTEFNPSVQVDLCQERARERERQTDRETDRQTERQRQGKGGCRLAQRAPQGKYKTGF